MSDPTGPGPAVPVVQPIERTRLAPRYKVFLHNDPITTMAFVTRILQQVFGLERHRATAVMREAHERGVAFVIALSFEQAEFRVGLAHGQARAAGYPLTLTYEPE